MADLNLEPKKRFELCYITNLIVALEIVDPYVESLGLRALTPGERVLTLSKQLEHLKQEAEAFGRKDFLIFADHKGCLYNVFSTRFLFFQYDEEPLLLEGLVLVEKIKCITRLLARAKKEYAALVMADFSEGKENILLYELHERPLGMSQKEYYKMMNCCIQKKGECVSLEFESIRKRFVENNADNPLLMDEVILNIHLLDEVFKKDQPLTVTELYAHLSKLTGLPLGSLPQDRDEFHRQFYRFDPEKSFFHALSPRLIHLAHEQIGEGKLSPVPVCCLSLIRHRKWLMAVFEGKIGLKDPPDAYFKLLVDKCHENSIDISKKLKGFFQIKYPYGNFTKEQYKGILLDKLKKCRMELKEFKYPQYYQLQLNREDSRDNFVDQCWLDIYMEDHTCEMGQAIVLHEMIGFYFGKLLRLDPGLVHPTLDTGRMKRDFKVILSIMVLSPETIERLWKAFNLFSLAVSLQKPLLFRIEDLKDVIEEIYREAIRDLIALLASQPGEVIETYAKKLLMELEERPLLTPGFGQGLEKYVSDLKRYSKKMLKCIPTRQSSPLENKETPFDEMQRQVIKPEIPKLLAFNCKNTKDEVILAGMKYLVKIGAIPEDTTFTHFNSKFNGMNGTEPIEWLAAQGDLATFIKELYRIMGPEFAPNKQHLNIASICFVQIGGIPFDPQKLRFSKPTMLKQKFIKAARKFKL